MTTSDVIWAHSGDSHFMEPPDFWSQILPKPLADRMPRSEKDPDSDFETVYVDGQTFRRKLPRVAVKKTEDGKTMMDLESAAPGTGNVDLRLLDLDNEGIWAEVMYPSLGLWANMITDRDLVRAACRAENEYRKEAIQDRAPDRFVPAAAIPMLDIQDAVEALGCAADLGLHVAALPTGVSEGMPDYNRDDWEPLWATAEECGMVLGFHIGTDGLGAKDNVMFNGPGGAVLNYVGTTYGGQWVAMKLVTSGALERHPDLKILISEGGATWVPFIGDRMNEGYRQHSMWVRPMLSHLPKETLYRQVYTSFQHDETAPAALWAMGYQNVMWGSDYPHIEGTYGHTQKTLHGLFDDLDPGVSHRIRIGAFKELFPHITGPPES